ncbi:hypothetical protein Cpir12675_006269 [Ceratocystis pirilliformis]|uniref:Autophagy-related protein 101 n=1 Tax=Ceratocystis pirilliformis TaxID=259994 RepID=A0ABR3YIM5_9PEZI
MDQPQQQNPHEFVLEAISDPDSVREIVKALLHTIFFHRYFPTIEPRTRRCLDLPLPYVVDAELETLIDQRVAKLAHDLELARVGPGGIRTGTPSANSSTTSSPLPLPHGGVSQADQSGNKRGIVKIQFFERRRRTGWIPRADEEVCWESWILKVSLAQPRNDNDRAKLRKAMSRTLLNEVINITNFVSLNKGHIPPITSSSNNPFPYQITVNPKEASWSGRLRMY